MNVSTLDPGMEIIEMPRLVKSFINTKRDNYIAEANNQVFNFSEKGKN